MKAARTFTLVLPYYENPTMLALQLERILSYETDVLRHMRLIVVDDGSPAHPAPIPASDSLLAEMAQYFRIEVDVRWNWIAARNIGHHHAATEWVLFTDIDHLLPEETARRIIFGKLGPENIYRFSRVNYPAGDAYKPHPNTWLMTRAMFDRVGGYDERFSGFYGTDGMFRDRCEAAANKVKMLPEVMERVDREVIPDASTTTYERKAKQDRENVPRIRAEVLASGDLKPKRLSFPYHRTFPAAE